MRVEVTYEPRFHLPLAGDDVRFLAFLAENHNDLSFKVAARSGFLSAWSTFLRDVARPGSAVVATWAEIVLLLKLLLDGRSGGLLSPRDLEHANRLHNDLERTIDRWHLGHRPEATVFDTEGSLR